MIVKTCEKCNAECCRYVAAEIDKPEKEKDFDEIKWFVSHKNVHVYVDEEGDWYVEFLTPCRFLGKNNKCLNYENRPKLCKDYEHDECTFYNEYTEKHRFKTIKDIEKYMKEHFRKKKNVKKNIRKS